MSPTPNAPLLTIRSAVILLTALLVGVTAGFLSYQAEGSLPGAVLWGGGATGGAIMLFHGVVGRS
jgi:hypothetical protein